MSFGCSWEPVEFSDNRIPTGFKYAVAQRWFGHDGSLRDAIELGSGSKSYLIGLMDASNEGDDVYEGAKILCEAIETHGKIRFRIGPR